MKTGTNLVPEDELLSIPPQECEARRLNGEEAAPSDQPRTFCHVGPLSFPTFVYLWGFFLLILYYFFNLNFGVKFYFLKK